MLTFPTGSSIFRISEDIVLIININWILSVLNMHFSKFVSCQPSLKLIHAGFPTNKSYVKVLQVSQLTQGPKMAIFESVLATHTPCVKNWQQYIQSYLAHKLKKGKNELEHIRIKKAIWPSLSADTVPNDVVIENMHSSPLNFI